MSETAGGRGWSLISAGACQGACAQAPKHPAREPNIFHDYLHMYGIGAARVSVNMCMRYLRPSSRGTCTSAGVTCALRRGAAALFWQEPDTVGPPCPCGRPESHHTGRSHLATPHPRAAIGYQQERTPRDITNVTRCPIYRTAPFNVGAAGEV